MNKNKYNEQKKAYCEKENIRRYKDYKKYRNKTLGKGEHDVFLYFHYAKKLNEKE